MRWVLAVCWLLAAESRSSRVISLWKPPLLPALGAVLPDALIEQVQGLFAERVYLETTYLDEDMRIGRGPGRELYVLSKRPGAGSADL